MSGRKIPLGKSVKIKDGKIVVVQQYRDASHAIRAKQSKKIRVVKRSAEAK